MDGNVIHLFPDAKRIGNDRYKALCFEHDDSTPSLVVNRHARHGWRYHCFVCGADGDEIDVLTKRDGFTWAQAKRAVGDEAVAPRDIWKPRWTMVCDACRDERVDVRNLPHLVELTSTWEIASDACATVGPACLSGQTYP